MDDGRRHLSRVPSITAVSPIATVSVISWGRIKPAAARSVKEPASIVVRSPAPGLGAGKGPAEARVPHPLPHGEGRPAQARAEGAPAVAVAAAGRPGTVGGEVGGGRRIVGR